MMDKLKSFVYDKRQQVCSLALSYSWQLREDLFAVDLTADDTYQVVLFSSTAIALYGYDQGMMSLINTNKDYLSTMGLEEESPQVGVIVVCTHSSLQAL